MMVARNSEVDPRYITLNSAKAVPHQLHTLAYRFKESSSMDSKLPVQSQYQPVDVEIEPPLDAPANAVSSISLVRMIRRSDCNEALELCEPVYVH